MELYLDSADITEIKEAFQLGFLAGLTTTPTFMHRHGIKDIDVTIVELSKIVPILQIEALGNTAEDIVAEAERQDALGLDKLTTVYKIPISLEGVKACKQLKDKGFKVNIHLIYTLQQAYLALEAGADYICPLIGRLQDQGTDALQMLEQIVGVTNYYEYDAKVMFSSVRNVEHIRNAIQAGVHTITAPWNVMKQLAENHFTAIGTKQFTEHTRLMTVKIRDVMSTENPILELDKSTVGDCLLKMTSKGFGAVTLVDSEGFPKAIFTDGDLRRLINKAKSSANIIDKAVKEFSNAQPITVEANAFLIDAQQIFSAKHVDQLVVVEGGKVVGMLDIQDLAT